MHYYQHHISDYISHTAHLDEIEDLAYRRMLDYCYLHECGLPETIDEIARVIRMQTHCERIANVLREYFFVANDGTWHNKRADDEIAEYRVKSEKSAQAARKRWKNDDANAMRTQCERNANHKPLTINHKPITKRESNPTPAGAGRARDGCRLPDDWTPDVVFAASNGMSELDALTEAERFRDYWRAVAGAKGRKTDWNATWRNWIRRAVEQRQSSRTPPDRAGSPVSFVERHTDQSWRVGL